MPNFLGKLLTIDLTNREVQIADFPEELARRFLGGRGFNAWRLLEHIGLETDPLGPENVLILSCGLLTGTQAPASSRLHIGARSPLTGLLGSSNVGGHFGAELRAAGFQSVLIRGRAERPVVLWLHDDQVEIRDADDLWGLDAWATQSQLQETLGQARAKIMAIGPGGENRVRYACIMTDRGHAAGRTGMGAVMGSKNLKAIAVRKTSEVSKDFRSLKLVKRYAEQIRSAPRYDTYARYSNSAYVTWAREEGLLSTRNYRQTQFEGADQIDGRQMIKYVTRSRSCHRCPVHCKADLKVPSGRFATVGDRPDIEPIVALGSKCGLDDVEALLYLYNLAGQLGIDVISTGGVLAFAMELYERGILTDEDTGGVALTWGSAEAMETVMRQIAGREGLGAVLAEGVQRAAQLIGRGAEQYAFHSKGLELTAYDPRGALGTALGYAVSTRGADFTSVYAIPEYRWDAAQGREVFGSEKAVDRLSIEGKGALVKRSMIVSAILDSLGLCKVPILSVVGDFSLENEAALASALSGWPLSAADLLAIGERILNVERLFNLRHGAMRADDDLPDRFTEEPLPDGPTRGMTVAIQPMVRDFYAAMGWSDDGWPTREKLKELGIETTLDQKPN
jgi:aldehyde:ferredoxin oxidoreductase